MRPPTQWRWWCLPCEKRAGHLADLYGAPFASHQSRSTTLPKRAAWRCVGMSRGQRFWQIAGKNLAADQHDAARSAACPEISLWTLKTGIQVTAAA